MPFARKLTVQQKRSIQAWASFGRNLSDIARRLGVSHQTVRRAIQEDRRESHPEESP